MKRPELIAALATAEARADKAEAEVVRLRARCDELLAKYTAITTGLRLSERIQAAHDRQQAPHRDAVDRALGNT